MKIGVVTIGQSPRDDMIPDIETVLSGNISIIQSGALDDFTYEEVISRFSPQKGDDILITRMRDGRQVKIAEQPILPLLQSCIHKLEEQGAEAVLMVCSGKFPAFRHNTLLLKPQELLHAVTSKIADGSTVGLIIPDKDQIDQITHWWNNNGVNVDVEVASPYQVFKGIEDAARRLRTKQVSVIFMDCMGYTIQMKQKVREITGKPVLLPRTLAAAVINELFGEA